MASLLKERQKVRKREQGAADRGRDTMGEMRKRRLKLLCETKKQIFKNSKKL